MGEVAKEPCRKRICLEGRKEASKQASKQYLFVNAGWLCGSYTADVGLRLYGLCPQSCHRVLIDRPRKDGQLSWLLAFGL